MQRDYATEVDAKTTMFEDTYQHYNEDLAQIDSTDTEQIKKYIDQLRQEIENVGVISDEDEAQIEASL